MLDTVAPLVLAIEVSDTGIDIPEEKMQEVFGGFKQVYRWECPTMSSDVQSHPATSKIQ